MVINADCNFFNIIYRVDVVLKWGSKGLMGRKFEAFEGCAW